MKNTISGIEKTFCCNYQQWQQQKISARPEDTVKMLFVTTFVLVCCILIKQLKQSRIFKEYTVVVVIVVIMDAQLTVLI